MLEFPEKTLFGCKIPKSKFCFDATLAKEIESIVWRNKFTSSTLNAEVGSKVVELDVIEVILKQKSVNTQILKVIDKSVPYHLLFLLRFEDKYMACMGYKELDKLVVKEYFKTAWLSFEDLPLKIEGFTLDEVHDNFILQLNQQLNIKNSETLKEAIICDVERRKIEKKIAQLEKQARAEKQPKRKFELVQNIEKLKVFLNENK